MRFLIHLLPWLFKHTHEYEYNLITTATLPDKRDFALEQARREYYEDKARIELLREDIRLMGRRRDE